MSQEAVSEHLIEALRKYCEDSMSPRVLIDVTTQLVEKSSVSVRGNTVVKALIAALRGWCRLSQR